jgi:hypothetical protein
MRPQNPELVTAEAANGYRLTVPSRMVPSWCGPKGDNPVHLVPLLWKREVALPDGHQLEAWLVWGEGDPSEDWIVNPKSVLDPDSRSQNQHHLQTLMYNATLVVSDRKYRLSCAGLLKYLAERSGAKLWISDERGSLGVMTDFAYHTSYGNLRL